MINKIKETKKINNTPTWENVLISFISMINLPVWKIITDVTMKRMICEIVFLYMALILGFVLKKVIFTSTYMKHKKSKSHIWLSKKKKYSEFLQ